MPRVSKKTVEEKPAAKAASAGSASEPKTAFAKGSGESRKVSSRKSVKADVVDMTGKVVSTMSLPESIFGRSKNDALLAQAVRVYLANQRAGTATVKTRGEVRGSTRKVWRQKGTGRARHGGVRAPIFVGGGVVFGPKARDYTKQLSKKMRRAALFTALSAKLSEKQLTILSGTDKLAPKTKEVSGVLTKLGVNGKGTTLVIVTDTMENLKRGARNIPSVLLAPFSSLSAYNVIDSTKVVFHKEALEQFVELFAKGK